MVSCHPFFDLRDTHWDDDPPVKSLWSYPVRSTHFGTYMSSCFLPGYASLICGSDSVMDLGDQDCIVDDWWLEAIWFFWPITHLIPYWGIFPLRLRFVDLHWFAWPSQLWDARWADDLTSFCLDSPVGPSLRHSIRLIFFDIIMIIGWSYSRCIGSHITISVEYMSDLLYIPMESFLSYQGRSSTSDAMLGHIPFFSYRDDRFFIDLLWFSSLSREILYLLYRSLFLWFSSRWAFGGAWHSGCNCPTIHDLAVDCFDEIMVVALMDYSLETP